MLKFLAVFCDRAGRFQFRPDRLIDELPAAGIVGRHDDGVLRLRGIVPGDGLDALFRVGDLR